MVVRQAEPVEASGWVQRVFAAAAARGRGRAPHFSVLGPLIVRIGERPWQPVPGAKNRILLACLLLRANQVVSIESLAQRLWGSHPPQDERRVVQTYVARLRQWLGEDGAIIRTWSGGYGVELSPDRLDLLEFRRLLRLADQTDSPEQEGALLRRAVGLWRGGACEDVASETLHQHDVAVLQEERRRALERRIDLDLSSGKPTQCLIPELRTLTLDHPLRERHWAQLMRALHQSGRRAEALDAYREAFGCLRDELGVEPGLELRELHQAILADGTASAPGTSADESTTPSGTTVGDEAAPSQTPMDGGELPQPRELPADVSGFVGRVDQLETLDQALTHAGATVIVGRAGVGKTALAIRWACSAAASFPDGQLFIDLGGFDTLPPLPPVQALRILLHGLGVHPHDIPDEEAAAAALYRSRTAGRRLLIVLDNARDTGHVRPLLPGNGPAVIITSRNQLRGLVAGGTAVRIALQPLPPREALALLAGQAGHHRLHQKPQQARILAELCEHLPLALRIVGERLARVPGLSTDALVREIEGDSDPAIHRVLSWSYEGLDPATRRTLRLAAALYPDNVLEPEPVAALVGLPLDRLRLHLDELTADHLAEQTGPRHYRLPRLVRAHAAIESRRNDRPAEIDAAVARLLAWVHHSLSAAVEILAADRRLPELTGPCPMPEPMRFADRAGALQWYAEHRRLLAALPEWACGHQQPEAADHLTGLTETMSALLHRRHDPNDGKIGHLYDVAERRAWTPFDLRIGPLNDLPSPGVAARAGLGRGCGDPSTRTGEPEGGQDGRQHDGAQT